MSVYSSFEAGTPGHHGQTFRKLASICCVVYIRRIPASLPPRMPWQSAAWQHRDIAIVPCPTWEEHSDVVIKHLVHVALQQTKWQRDSTWARERFTRPAG